MWKRGDEGNEKSLYRKSHLGSGIEIDKNHIKTRVRVN